MSKRFYQLLPLVLLMSAASQAELAPSVSIYEVLPEDSWRSLAAHFQLSERQLRLDYNASRFMVPLAAGEHIWVPERQAEQEPAPAATALSYTLTARQHKTASAPLNTATASTPIMAPSRPLPQLGRPNPAHAPKSQKMLLTVATAAQAAATNKLEKFVEQQSSMLADNTLSFGSQRLSQWLPLQPQQWDWDYQLPLFDKKPKFNSRMALPVSKAWHGELGVDYRDERLTYQAGLHFSQPLTQRISGHITPVMDYQTKLDHQRAGLLVSLQSQDWALGAGQYQPLSEWRTDAGRLERPAAGQLLFGEGRIAGISGLSVSGQYYQWQGQQLQLYGSGDKHKAALSRQWALNYSPWKILKLQSALLSNSKHDFESTFQVGIELPLGIAPGRWWQPLSSHSRYDDYQPLQHHKVMVLEHH